MNYLKEIELYNITTVVLIVATRSCIHMYVYMYQCKLRKRESV